LLSVRSFCVEHPTPGDEEFDRMNYPRARAIYDSILATSPDSAVVLWKIARAYICEADVHGEDIKRVLYYKAEDYAKRSFKADSNSSMGRAWLAAAFGNVAMFEGGKTKISLVYVIKAQVDRAIELDSTNDLAYTILGSYYKALGDISWLERQIANLIFGTIPDGGYDESVIAFKKAIHFAPLIIRHHFELGKVYKEQDRKADALAEFKLCQTLPPHVAMDTVMLKDLPKLIHDVNH
jgi:tetratricopeptide (TPR) repeat protein